MKWTPIRRQSVKMAAQKRKEHVLAEMGLNIGLRLITDTEAGADGFPGGREELREWMKRTYRERYNPRMQIITIRWTMKCEGVFNAKE
jgi:hypothetical protein